MFTRSERGNSWQEVFFSDYRINILDSIMDMMEKYARNLEENVEERAQELMEEKRKTDRLLYRLLPAWVNCHVTLSGLK